MSKNLKKITTWLLSALASVALVLGIIVSTPQVKTASAADAAVTFNAACLGDAKDDTYGTAIRFDTAGQTWASYHNWVSAAEWKSISDYTTINGRTITEINNSTSHNQKITLMMQPADGFSFLRAYIPAEIMPLSDIKSMGILSGWSFNNGTANFTSSEVTFLRAGNSMVLANNYTAQTKIYAKDITISQANLTVPQDTYLVTIDMGVDMSEISYEVMRSDFASIYKAIYINGKSIDEWNEEKLAEDPRYGDPKMYSVFPQNSEDPGHLAKFVKPIGLYGTKMGFNLYIFQDIVADCETVTITVGSGCTQSGYFMVAERKTQTVLTQNVVDLTNKLTFLDNSKHNPESWGPTKLYMINTNGEAAWTKAPIGGCLNEHDPSQAGGGQTQMKYILFNGSTLYEINKNDNGSYNSTQDNIKNGSIYAPILVAMSTELGATLKLTIPTNYTNGKAGHEEIIIKKGFNVKENGTSYVVTSDITFTNNGTTVWNKQIKGTEIKTEVTGIITKANRNDGGGNENFVIFQLSKNDYDSCNTTAIADVSSLYGYIDIDGNVVNARPSEPFFNVWGIKNSVAFRAPGLSATQLQQVKYITIKAGAKFPAYATQSSDKIVYYVTTEDVTFIHNVPNDTWEIGEAPSSEHTVTFKVGEATYTTQTVTDGSVATAPAAPTKEEDANFTYTFNQWTLNGAAYDFATPVTGDITLVAEFTATQKTVEKDIADELYVVNEGSSNATENYTIKTKNTYWTKAPKGGCLNEYDVAGLNPVGGQIQMKYIYFNGKSLYDINREDDGAYGSTQANIAGDNGQYAPILVVMGQVEKQYSYIKLSVPTGYPNTEASAIENHKTIEIKKGFSVTEGATTWTVSKDLLFTNLNGTWVTENDTVSSDGVTIGNPRIDGVAKELYKVDIASDLFNITCNDYDFMYGGSYAEYRKFFYINGVSVYDINTKTDDSSYVYSTGPMTGNDDALFAHPVLIETHNQGGDSKKITLWIHKNYLESLGDDITITLGAGYNAFINDGKVLAESVDFSMIATVRVDNGTNVITDKMIKGSILTLSTPTKEMTSTATYFFDNWYIKGTDTVFNNPGAITEDIEIEARFSVETINLIETKIDSVVYHINTNEQDDKWFYFVLSEHDYSDTVDTYDATVDTIKQMGLLEKITIKGNITLGSKKVSEATLAELGAANGYGEAVYINIWGREETKGSLAFRVKGDVTITEVTVEAGAFFPSYQYISGATTTETYYTLLQGTTLINNNKEGLTGTFLSDKQGVVDICMADGAAVRVTSNDATSGIRFEVKVAKEDIEYLASEIGKKYTSVVFGVVIAPTDYLVGGKLNPDWLGDNGYKYIEITYDLMDLYGNFPKEDGKYYSYFGTIGALKESNYNREFSAIGYVMLYMEDGEMSIYARYDKNNSRSASYVANAAVNDRSSVKTEEYKQYISVNNNYSRYTESENVFISRYIVATEETAINSQDLTALATRGGTQTITPTTQKLAGPYVELVYSTNVNVWGEFTYTDGTKTAKEDFYLQAGTTKHKQFLDVFRYNGVGYGMNTSNLSMTSIKFTNAELANSDAPAGKVKVYGLYSKNETIDMDNQEIYLTVTQDDGSEITVGAHLGLGGSLTYLAKSGIYEGVIGGSSGWKNGTVAISTDKSVFDSTNRYKSGSDSSSYSTEAGYYGSATSSKAADGAVNLINNFDAGRQIQQSWYAQVGGSSAATNGENGYDRAFCYTASAEGQYWPYNPVQAGDVVSNPGQIVDYEINTEKNYIYVKARAMDWAKGYDPEKPCANAVEGGVTTKSYVENYYRLAADGTLTVDNGFVDWNGFEDMETCDWASTELPAVYPVHTLNYYVSNTNGDGSWEDDLEYKNDLKPWSGGTAYHQFDDPSKGDTKVEDWFAWANGGNGSAFGMGIYIPNVSQWTSGRSNTSTAYYTDVNFQNSNALPVDDYEEWNWGSFSYVSKVSAHAQRGNILLDKGMMSNMQEIKYTYQSAYVSNTSYTAPGINFRMEAYKPIEYSYVVCLGAVDTIRSTFKEIKDNGTVTNAGNGYEKVGLDAWARADKMWTW